MENEEILQQIRNGNKEVIKTVYKDNAKDIYNFAKSITGEHDSAMDATKSTFVKLFTNIQKGENPTNIRLAALKIAYDEACAIALPSSENIDSPFDRDRLQEPEETEETVESAAPVVVPAEDAGCEAEEEAVPEETVSEAIPAEETEAEPDEAEKENVDLNVSVGGAAAAEEEPEYNIVLNEQESDISATQVIDVDVEYNEPDIEDTEDESQEDQDEETEKVKAKGSPVLVILNIILVIILLWLVYGLLRTFDILPSGLNFDLGYSWFNSTIYPIF